MKPVELIHESFHAEDNGGGLRYTVKYTTSGGVLRIVKIEAIQFQNVDEPADPVLIDITHQLRMMDVMIEAVTDWDEVYKRSLQAQTETLPFTS